VAVLHTHTVDQCMQSLKLLHFKEVHKELENISVSKYGNMKKAW